VRRILSLLLVLALCLSLAACAKTEKADTKFESRNGAKPNPELLEFVETAREELLIDFEAQVELDSDLTFASSLEVVGDGFVITIRINELDDLTDNLKQQLQEAYDALMDSFEAFLKELQDEIPVLEYFLIYICECDGDGIAVVETGDLETAPEIPVIEVSEKESADESEDKPEQIQNSPAQTQPEEDSAADDREEETEENEGTAFYPDDDADSLQDYVEAYGDTLASAMEEMAASSGLNSTVSVDASDNGIVITFCFEDLDNLTDEEKQTVQEAYDEMSAAFSDSLDELQVELPGLEYLEIVVCEKDGDVIATLRVE